MNVTSFVRAVAVRGCAAAVVLAAAGCGDFPFGPDRERAIATIELEGFGPVEVEVPEVVAAGASFQVAVTTFGGGCVRDDRVNVSVQGLRAVITPYTLVTRGGTCTAELRTSKRTAVVRFDEPGEAVVEIRGWSESENGVISIQRTVLVQ